MIARELGEKSRIGALLIWDATGNLNLLTPALIARLRLIYLEFCSPEGDTIQLVASCHATPIETIMGFDLSICQLALDDQYLSFAPWAWSDLLQNRFRPGPGAIRWPDSTFRRMFKYARRGFWPYPRTAFILSYSALAWLAEKIPRYLFALAGNPPAKG